MKYTSRMLKLANIFEQKMLKYATEADSSEVTLTARPTINDYFTKVDLGKQIENGPGKVMQAENVSGTVEIGGTAFITASKDAKGLWKISDFKLKSEISGDALSNDKVVKSTNTLVQGLIAKIKPLLEASFNKMSGFQDNTTMTNVEVNCSSASRSL